MKEKRFTLKTAQGSWRLLALFLVIVLLCSLSAQAIVSRGYKIQISDVTYEVRGSELSFELYKPADVSSEDQLPCIILAHGGSESLAANSLVAWEFAKRGFVVMNVSMYSCGLSGQPAINDDGTREENYFRGGSQGVYDALQYARSISYVDKTRIGMWGHSAGYYCISGALTVDNDYLTLNDRMLNVLYEQFGIEISEEQLTEDADEIAAAQLGADQLSLYEYMRTEQQKIVDSYVKAARVVEFGFGAKALVAGHEVLRDPQMNTIVGLGTHEGTGNYYLGESDAYKAIFHTGTDAVARNSWYVTADYARDPLATSTPVGKIFEVNVENNTELSAAVDNGTARYFLNPETFHNGMLWDSRAVSQILEFFTQTLGYNGGDIGDSRATPISTRNLASSYVALGLSTITFLAAIARPQKILCKR